MGLHLVVVSFLVLSWVLPAEGSDIRIMLLNSPAEENNKVSSLAKESGPSSIPAPPSNDNLSEVSVIRLIHLSRQAVGSGRLEEALRWARASVSKDPAYNESWKQVGRVLMLMGNYSEALKYFQPALDLKADDLEVEEWILRSLVASDRLKELAEKLERSSPKVWVGLDSEWVLQLLFRTSELKDRRVAALILKTLRRKNLSPGIHSTLDILDLLAQKKPEEAEKLLSNSGPMSEEDRPFLGLAWFVLGRTYQEIQEHPKAIPAYRKALELFPDNIPAWRDLGWALKRAGQVGEAADAWEQGFGKDPRYITWLLWIAEARLDNKQSEQALDALNKFLKVQPNDTNAQILKLAILSLTGKNAELQNYEKQIQKVPGGDQVIFLGRALTLQKQGQYSQAARLLENFTRLHPKDLQARDLLIQTYTLWAASNPGRPALEPLQKLSALEPGRAGIQRDLGWSLFAHNRYPEAIQAWERALKDPSIDRKRLIRQIVAGLAEEGEGNQARQLFRRWEPATSFTAIGMEILKFNRVVAAREFLTAAWDAGEERTRMGLFLAYTEARTGSCSHVAEHLTPFIDAGLTSATSDDLSHLLTALSQCSFEPTVFPILVRLDPILKPSSEEGTEITTLLAKAAAEQKNFQNLKSAWLLYQKALARDPNRVQVWLMAAETADDLGMHSEAISLLEGLLKRTTSGAISEGIKGWLADNRKETEVAVAHYRKSLALEPSQPDLRFFLFQDLISLKQFDEARTESDWFKEKVAAGEGTLKGYLAETLSATGKTQEALVQWQELFLANPEKTRYGIETARALFSLDRPEEALTLLDSILLKSPDPKGYELVAEIQGAMGMTELVLKTTEQGLAFKPTRTLWQLQAEAAESLKKPALALESAKNWAADDPGNVPALQIIFKALLDLKKDEEARTLLEGLLQRNPQFLPGLIHLREIASSKNQSSRAVDYSRETVQQRPWDKHTILHQAISLAQDERFVAAFQLLRPLAPLEPNTAIPVLIYQNVTAFPYPGRNTVSQVTEHLQYLKDQGYDFITFSDLADALQKNKRQVLVVIANTETKALLQIDAVLEKIKGRAVLAEDFRSLQVEVPFQPTPKTLAQLESSGRWVMAWSGVAGTDLRTEIDGKGTQGNILTHKIMTGKGKEIALDMERRLGKIFSEASGPYKKQSPTIFLYPGGDYGQTSLDTDPEAIGILQKTVSQYFNFAVTTDPYGFITSSFDPRRLPGRMVPPTWDNPRLAAHLSQQNPWVRARLELAKVLFWQGQHIQAGQWYKKAEEAGADPEEVNFHWGNNAYQYGDLPTAITKLRLAQDLNPESERNQNYLDRALWKKKWFINPEGIYWEDSDKRSFLQWGLDLGGYLFKTIQLDIFGQRLHWEREGYGSENGTHLGLGGKWFFHPDHWITGRLWGHQVDSKGSQLGGFLNLHWSNPLWESHVEFLAAREQIDTVEAVRADIQSNRFGLNTYSRLIDSFDLFADLEYMQRTDQNNTLLFNGRLVWRMKEWPYVGFGYRIRLGDSDRKADEYYAPKKLQQHQLYFNSRGEYRLLHYQFSIQGGYAKEEDTDWRFVWSTQLHLDIRLTRRLDLYGQYRHQESPVYEYDELSFGFLFRF